MWALYFLTWQDLAAQHAPNLTSYRSFTQNVALAVYGDDNVCTVAPGITWFNFNTFKKAAAKYGFSITDAAKKGGIVPDFVPLAELEFLKRSFQRMQGYYVGPLALASIAKSFMWARDRSYTIKAEHVPSLGGTWPIATKNDVVQAACNNMWPELALHGEDIYTKFRDTIMRQASRLPFTLSPPTWQEACAKLGYMVY